MGNPRTIHQRADVRITLRLSARDLVQGPAKSKHAPHTPVDVIDDACTTCITAKHFPEDCLITIFASKQDIEARKSILRENLSSPRHCLGDRPTSFSSPSPQNECLVSAYGGATTSAMNAMTRYREAIFGTINLCCHNLSIYRMDLSCICKFRQR